MSVFQPISGQNSFFRWIMRLSPSYFASVEDLVHTFFFFCYLKYFCVLQQGAPRKRSSWDLFSAQKKRTGEKQNLWSLKDNIYSRVFWSGFGRGLFFWNNEIIFFSIRSEQGYILFPVGHENLGFWSGRVSCRMCLVRKVQKKKK